MFTGIIKELGKVVSFSPYQKRDNLKVENKKIALSSQIGDSISVNGVCLTVVQIKNDVLSFDLLPETRKLTNLGILKPRDIVNLEESLVVGDKVSGHFVSGHIDCSGVIKNKGIRLQNYFFEVVISKEKMKFLAAKGSVAIDGISLTVAEVSLNSFSVYVIPHTLNHTTLKTKTPGAKVNIELDLFAKYSFNPR